MNIYIYVYIYCVYTISRYRLSPLFSSFADMKQPAYK